MPLYGYDSFDGSSNIDLVDRLGQLGATWTPHPAYPYSYGTTNVFWLSGNGRAFCRFQSYSTALILASGVPAGTEYDLRLPWTSLTHADDNVVGAAFKASATAADHWGLRYWTGNRSWALGLVTAGSFAVVQSYADILADGATRLVEVRVRDTSPRISIWIDGVQRMSSDDATAPGNRVGLFGAGVVVNEATTGLHLDGFALGSAGFVSPAYDLLGPGAGTPMTISTSFTVRLAAGVNPGPVTITPAAAGLSGPFSPGAIPLSNTTRSATFSFTPGGTVGSGTIGATNSAGLENPPSLAFASAFRPPSRLAYWLSKLGDRHGTSPNVANRYTAGTGYFLNGPEHYDVVWAMRSVERLMVKYNVAPTDWTAEKAAAIVRYRDRAILEAPGTFAAYYIYPTGIADHHAETNDPADISALDELLYRAGSSDGAGGYIPWNVPVQRRAYEHMGVCREVAYMLKTCIEQRRRGMGDHPLLVAFAECAIEHINQWIAPAGTYRAVWCKPFMSALTMRTLIAWWKDFKDSPIPARAALAATIPAKIKALVDYIYADLWYPPGTPVPIDGGTWDKGALKYSNVIITDPSFAPITGQVVGAVATNRVFRGPASLSTVDDYYKYSAIDLSTDPGNLFLCVGYAGATREFTLNPDYGPNAITPGSTFAIKSADIADGGTGAAPDLAHLMAPAAAWLYWYFKVVLGDTPGATAYRTIHDEFFDGCQQSWQPAGSQKVFNQSAYWTEDGLAWRDLADAAGAVTPPAPAGTNVLMIHSPAGGVLMIFRPGEVTVPTRAQVEAAAVSEAEAYIAAEGGETVHGADPVKAEEHHAVMDLVPFAGRTATAILTGDWSDPDTWLGRVVPVALDRAWIMPGRIVTVDNLDAKCLTLRDSGMLRYAPDRDGSLEVETVVVDHDGTLEMGTIADPIQAAHTATMVFKGSGSFGADAGLYGRGLISHGAVSIHGAIVTPWLALGASALAGATSLTLATPPTGWAAGDKLVLAPTDVNWQDEVLEIVSIVGTTVTIAGPLQYNHAAPTHVQLATLHGQAPPGNPLKVHVGHMTRNVRFRSLASAPITSRGHVMFMHSPNVDVRYASFDGLGRTDKAIVPSATNPQGRYPVHFHRTGASGAPIVAMGLTVDGSPGWGVVNHTANVAVSNGVVHDCTGSCYAAEAGNEIGSFAGNLGIRSMGAPGLNPDLYRDRLNVDYGFNGHGFWLQSPGVAMVENVVAGVASMAIMYYPIDYTGIVPGIELLTIAEHRDNTMYAARRGLRMYGTEAPVGAPHVLAGLTCWGLTYDAFGVDYSRNMVISGARFVGGGTANGVGAVYLDGSPRYRFADCYVVGYTQGLEAGYGGISPVVGGYFKNGVDLRIFKNVSQANLMIGVRDVEVTGATFAGGGILMEESFQENTSVQPFWAWFSPERITWNGQQFYYDEQAPEFVLTTPLAEFNGLTNAQLWANYGLAYAGNVRPPGTVAVAGLTGGTAGATTPSSPGPLVHITTYSKPDGMVEEVLFDTGPGQYLSVLRPLSSVHPGWNLITAVDSLGATRYGFRYVNP